MGASDGANFLKWNLPRVNRILFGDCDKVSEIRHTNPECGGTTYVWYEIQVAKVNAHYTGGSSVYDGQSLPVDQWEAAALQVANTSLDAGDNGAKWATDFTYFELCNWAKFSPLRASHMLVATMAKKFRDYEIANLASRVRACYSLNCNPMPELRKMAERDGFDVEFRKYILPERDGIHCHYSRTAGQWQVYYSINTEVGGRVVFTV